jgi:hypothetical protein
MSKGYIRIRTGRDVRKRSRRGNAEACMISTGYTDAWGGHAFTTGAGLVAGQGIRSTTYQHTFSSWLAMFCFDHNLPFYNPSSVRMKSQNRYARQARVGAAAGGIPLGILILFTGGLIVVAVAVAVILTVIAGLGFRVWQLTKASSGKPSLDREPPVNVYHATAEGPSSFKRAVQRKAERAAEKPPAPPRQVTPPRDPMHELMSPSAGAPAAREAVAPPRTERIPQEPMPGTPIPAGLPAGPMFVPASWHTGGADTAAIAEPSASERAEGAEVDV